MGALVCEKNCLGSAVNILKSCVSKYDVGGEFCGWDDGVDDDENE